MYKYETHLHTYPVSKCGKASVRETVEFYKSLGYDGIFITNHFLDGNINIDRNLPYEEKIDFYFSDYEEGIKIGNELGIKVFLGVELAYKGTDFLVYGLSKEWFLQHPEILDMKKSEELNLLMGNGALVIQAHPYREAGYIDHIRLFPRHVHGVELNASRTKEENEIAKLYAKHYNLLLFAGSDNHMRSADRNLGGMETERPIESVEDFITAVKNKKAKPFLTEKE